MKIEPEVLEKIKGRIRPALTLLQHGHGAMCETQAKQNAINYIEEALALLASVKEKKPSMCGIHGTENATQRQPYGSIRVWCPACADMAMQADLNDELAATETKPKLQDMLDKITPENVHQRAFKTEDATADDIKSVQEAVYGAETKPDAPSDADSFKAGWYAALKPAQLKVDDVTVEEISRRIQTWCFDDSIEEPFGAYLMRLYPHGLRVIPAAGEKS